MEPPTVNPPSHLSVMGFLWLKKLPGDGGPAVTMEARSAMERMVRRQEWGWPYSGFMREADMRMIANWTAAASETQNECTENLERGREERYTYNVTEADPTQTKSSPMGYIGEIMSP